MLLKLEHNKITKHTLETLINFSIQETTDEIGQQLIKITALTHVKDNLSQVYSQQLFDN